MSMEIVQDLMILDKEVDRLIKNREKFTKFFADDLRGLCKYLYKINNELEGKK